MQLSVVVLSLCIVVLAGYIAKKRGVLAMQDTKVINRVIIDFAVPALIFNAVYQQHISRDMILTTAVFILCELFIMGAAMWVTKALKKPAPTRGSFMACAAYGNTAFIGYPVTAAAYSAVSMAHVYGVSATSGQLLASKAMAAAVMYDQVGTFVVLYLVAVPIMITLGKQSTYSGATRRQDLISAFTHPSLIVLALTLLINAFGITVPKIVEHVATTLAGAVAPLVMISLGLMLKTSQLFKKDNMGIVLGMLLFKMFLMPLVIYLATMRLPIDPLIRAVAITTGAMPPAMQCAVLSERYGCERGTAAVSAILGAIITALSLPLLMKLIGLG
ncbi:MAG: AEC family transporter [Armatimonadota bacterium]